MGLRSMPRYETLVLSHTGHTGARILPRFSIRKLMGKWLSQTLARSSGYFSAVLPAPQPELGGLGVVLLRLR